MMTIKGMAAQNAKTWCQLKSLAAVVLARGLNHTLTFKVPQVNTLQPQITAAQQQEQEQQIGCAGDVPRSGPGFAGRHKPAVQAPDIGKKAAEGITVGV